MSIKERATSKKGLAIIIATLAGAVYIFFGYELDASTQQTAADVIGGLLQ